MTHSRPGSPEPQRPDQPHDSSIPYSAHDSSHDSAHDGAHEVDAAKPAHDTHGDHANHTTHPGSQPSQGGSAQPLGSEATPEKKSSSKGLWIVLGIIVALLAIAALVFALLRGGSDDDEESTAAAGNSTEAAAEDSAEEEAEETSDPNKPASPFPEGVDEDYFDEKLDEEEAQEIRDKDPEQLPVPVELANLTDSCFKDASVFGKIAEDGTTISGVVPTIMCVFGPENQYAAQYTRNEDAVKAERRAVRDQKLNGGAAMAGVYSGRGSELVAFTSKTQVQEEQVLAETLETKDAVIEYIAIDDDRDAMNSVLGEAGIIRTLDSVMKDNEEKLNEEKLNELNSKLATTE